MADFVALWNTERAALKEFYHAAMDDAERNRGRERRAAIIIQSVWRMYLAKRELKRAHDAARVLQRGCRNIIARMARRRYVIVALRNGRQKAFHDGAVKFQALYKGYWSRKYIHDHTKLKAYLQRLEDEAVSVRAVLNKHREKEEHRLKMDAMRQKHRKHMEKVNREHHLISTKLIPGVYHDGRGPVQEDELAKSVKGLHLTRKPATHLSRFGTDVTQWCGYTKGAHKPLPPVQGPFKSPAEVCDIKNTQKFYSLRAQTDYYTGRNAEVRDREQDWVRQVNPVGFHPSSNKSRAFNTYQPNLAGQSQFKDFLDTRVCQTTGPRGNREADDPRWGVSFGPDKTLKGTFRPGNHDDTSCRVPMRTMATVMGASKFNTTVRGVTTFDGVDA